MPSSSMGYFLSVLGIALSFILIKFRQQIGDAIGDPEWLKYVGGIYNALVIVAVFIVIWAVAYVTGTIEILFSPIKLLIPWVDPVEEPMF